MGACQAGALLLSLTTIRFGCLKLIGVTMGCIDALQPPAVAACCNVCHQHLPAAVPLHFPDC